MKHFVSWCEKFVNYLLFQINLDLLLSRLSVSIIHVDHAPDKLPCRGQHSIWVYNWNVESNGKWFMFAPKLQIFFSPKITIKTESIIFTKDVWVKEEWGRVGAGGEWEQKTANVLVHIKSICFLCYCFYERKTVAFKSHYGSFSFAWKIFCLRILLPLFGAARYRLLLLTV